MKFLVVLAAAAVAFVSAADLPPCDLTKLFAVSSSAVATTCKTQTGFVPSPGTIPTADKVALICKNADCQTVLAALSAASPTECLISGTPLRSGILDKYAAACAAFATTTAPAVTTAAPATTPATTPAITPATTPATTAPATTTTTPATTAPSTTKPGTSTTTTAPTTAPSTPKGTVSPSADAPKVTPSGRCKV